MQYLCTDGSLHVEATGDPDVPVRIEVQTLNLSTDQEEFHQVRLTGETAKRVAEQLLSIWGEDLDND